MPADLTACDAVTALTDATACDAVMTAADGAIKACTYTAAAPALGELDVHNGKLTTPSVTSTTTDSHLTLFGKNSIVGRSIVIHKGDGTGERWACATIGELRTATATFDATGLSGGVSGTVTFSGTEDGPTVVDTDLTGLSDGPNPWHVHVETITADTASCTDTGGHCRYTTKQSAATAGRKTCSIFMGILFPKWIPVIGKRHF